MPKRRYVVCKAQEPVLVVNVEPGIDEGSVYLLVADLDRPTDNCPTPIVYIGKTGGGVARIAQSAADKIKEGLDRGFIRINAYAVWCNADGKDRYLVPDLLERALLNCHYDRYGRWPLLNKVGRTAGRESEYFTATAINNVLELYGQWPSLAKDDTGQ